jgi:hypothetical protein
VLVLGAKYSSGQSILFESSLLIFLVQFSCSPGTRQLKLKLTILLVIKLRYQLNVLWICIKTAFVKASINCHFNWFEYENRASRPRLIMTSQILEAAKTKKNSSNWKVRKKYQNRLSDLQPLIVEVLLGSPTAVSSSSAGSEFVLQLIFDFQISDGQKPELNVCFAIPSSPSKLRPSQLDSIND